MWTRPLRQLSTHFPQEWKPKAHQIRPQVIVPLLISRPASLLSITALTAQFVYRENALFLGNTGNVRVEFMPKAEKAEGGRRPLEVKQRKFITLLSTELEHFWQAKGPKIVQRDTKEAIKTLTITPISDSIHLHLLTTPKDTTEATTREETLQKPEIWLIQQYITVSLRQFALPFMSGWFALGDLRLVEQNMEADAEMARGKEHKCDEHCDHKHD